MPKIGEIHDRLSAAEYKEVPDQFKSLYVEDGDAYVYKDPKVLKESMIAAKGERQTAVAERDDLKAKYKDVDPEKYKLLLGREKEFEDIDKVKQGELDAIKRDLESKYTGTISAKDKQIIDRDTRYANRVLGDDIKVALAKAGVTESGQKLLSSTIRTAVTVKMDSDGEPEFRILDAKGTQRLNDSADPFSIDDLVAEAKKDYPQLFGSNAGSGGGTQNQDKNVAVPTDEDPDSWSDAQVAAYIKQHSHQKYQALVIKAAEKKSQQRAEDRNKKRA